MPIDYSAPEYQSREAYTAALGGSTTAPKPVNTTSSTSTQSTSSSSSGATSPKTATDIRSQNAARGIGTPGSSTGTTPTQLASSPVVIGVAASRGEVLVRTNTGETYWKPGTQSQIAEATRVLSNGEYTYNKPYIPPAGVGIGKPIVGSVYSSPIENLQKKWRDKISSDNTISEKDYSSYMADYNKSLTEPTYVYNYRGQRIAVNTSALKEASSMNPEAKFNKMMGLGIIQPGSKLLSAENGISYISASDLIQQERKQAIIEKIKKTGANIEGNKYNILHALNSGVTPRELKQANFKDEDINQAVKAKELMFSSKPDYNTEKENFFKERGLSTEFPRKTSLDFDLGKQMDWKKANEDFEKEYDKKVENWSNYHYKQQELKAIFEKQHSKESTAKGAGTIIGGEFVMYDSKQGYMKVQEGTILAPISVDSIKMGLDSVKNMFFPNYDEKSGTFKADASGLATTIGSVGSKVAGVTAGAGAIFAGGSVAYHALIPKVSKVDFTPVGTNAVLEEGITTKNKVSDIYPELNIPRPLENDVVNKLDIPKTSTVIDEWQRKIAEAQRTRESVVSPQFDQTLENSKIIAPSISIPRQIADTRTSSKVRVSDMSRELVNTQDLTKSNVVDLDRVRAQSISNTATITNTGTLEFQLPKIPIFPMIPISGGKLDGGGGGGYGSGMIDNSPFIRETMETPEVAVFMPEGWATYNPDALIPPTLKKKKKKYTEEQYMGEGKTLSGISGYTEASTPFGIRHAKTVKKSRTATSGMSKNVQSLGISRTYRGKKLPGSNLGVAL